MKNPIKYWNSRTLDQQDRIKLGIGCLIFIIAIPVVCWLIYSGVMDWMNAWFPLGAGAY